MGCSRCKYSGWILSYDDYFVCSNHKDCPYPGGKHPIGVPTATACECTLNSNREMSEGNQAAGSSSSTFKNKYENKRVRSYEEQIARDNPTG